ncbi:MAG: PDZ domain-containing protein, partial [Saprospiraceae bacterium]|nr:PDZ domain-containing protein [Saprospiraceae bacterium]
IHETKGHNGFLGIVANPGKEGSLTLLDVVEGSPAEKAGLQKDDVINSINGQKLTNFNELIEVLDDLKPNDKVEIGYNRGEETKVTKATLAEHSNQTIEKIIEIETDEIHDHRGGNGDKMIWIEKGDEEMKFGDDADEIIIEETIEESEENGKKIIKKKKVITRIKKE